MRVDHLSEALTVTAQDQENLLNDPGIRVGFEVEFVARFEALGVTSARRSMSLKNVLQTPERTQDYFSIDYSSVRPLVARWIRKNADATQSLLDKPTVEESINYAREWFGKPVILNVGRTASQLEKFWTDNDWTTAKGRTAIVTKLLKLTWTPSLWFGELGHHIHDVSVADIWQAIRAEPRYGWANSEQTQVYIEGAYQPTLREAEEAIAQQLNRKGLSEPATTDYKLDGYRIDIDGSVKPDQRGDGYGIEIIGPPVSLSAALEDLKKILLWITENGHYTNESTGLHVGVSWYDQTPEVDKLKLLMLLGEDHLLRLFSRELNTYTESHLERLKKKISAANLKGRDWTKQRTFSGLIRSLKDKIDLKKYTTVNFLKLDRGYLEFRIMGNENYENRYQEIRDTILRYAFVLKAALDPTAFEQEYKRELARLFSQAANEASSEYPNAMTKYAVLASSTPATRKSTLSLFQRAEVALKKDDLLVAARILAILLDQANIMRSLQSPAVSRAALLSYQLLLRQHNISTDQLDELMQQAKVKPASRENAIEFLNQTKE